MRVFFLFRNCILIYVPVLLLFSGVFCSCGNTRHLIYMQGKFDTTKLSQVQSSDPVIQKGDLLSIIVYSDNPQATAIYNQALVTASGAMAGNGSSTVSIGGGSPTTPGYLVNEKGNIEFQGLGTLHIVGLTRAQLTDTLNDRLRGFLKNPYYTIRFLNYRFTMLGEVNKPAIYTIPGDRVNILEALAMAGDMTFYGRRDNVLIIRENDGKREFARLDLTKPEIMASPYFYIQQNDVVVFEPTKKKVIANDQVTIRDISIATAIVSTLAILYSIFKN